MPDFKPERCRVLWLCLTLCESSGMDAKRLFLNWLEELVALNSAFYSRFRIT